ncbi:MAG: transposase [Acidobacteria bacterium]|nr:transposase [Acidobacteriota bacterium]
MGYPRSKYVREGEEGVFHCFSRCVRRAFLCGYDAVSGRDFSHRKQVLVERLQYLATVFAIEVCAYAIMENHYHAILRIRPDIAALWSEREVAIRWLMLCPRYFGRRDPGTPPAEKDIAALTLCPELIEKLRKRLCSLSWFMGRLNEYVARMANKEDQVTGRFWEGRFECRELLDEAATVACMVYVDLNSIRAGVADTPEESDYTSIQERIQLWQKERMTTNSVPDVLPEEDNVTRSVEEYEAPTTSSNPWLVPISPDPKVEGILQMTPTEYFDLVDRSGRLVRSDKPGVISADLTSLLLRIGVTPDAWGDTISAFRSRYSLAAGLFSNMRSFADRIGRSWIKGLRAARTAFASSSP